MTSASNGECFFVDATDLTEEQIAITHYTYLKHARNYVENYERKPGMLEQIRPHTLDPFLGYYRKFNLKNPVLFVGCGSGRDIQELEKKNVQCVGVDLSPSMLGIAKNKGVNSQLHVMDLENLSFPKYSFSGIFCDSAITHTAKANLSGNLNNFMQLLEPGGILFVAFRSGDGRVYYTEDKVGGRRFNSTFTPAESEKLIGSTRFELLDMNHAVNPIPNRPSWFNYFLRKPL